MTYDPHPPTAQLPADLISLGSQSHPYASSYSSSASSSSSSVFSVEAASSQTTASSAFSARSSVHSNWDNDEPWSLSGAQFKSAVLQPKHTVSSGPIQDISTLDGYVLATSQCREQIHDQSGTWHIGRNTVTHFTLPLVKPCEAQAVAPEQRQHPRRCSASAARRPPPALVRQNDRKVNFVDNLVGEHLPLSLLLRGQH